MTGSGGATEQAGGLHALLQRRAGGAGVGLWAAGLSAVALSIAGVIGLGLGQPWLFPSLGPTLMVLAETPRQPSARPRSVLVGHLVGVAAGYVSLLVTGLADAPSVIEQGLTGAHVLAAVLSVALTAFVLQALHCPHPPAGATTLIVSLGLLAQSGELVVILLSVLLCTVIAVALNLLAGVRQSGVRDTDGRR